MIEETTYANEVADELGLTASAYAEDVTGEVDLTAAAYGEDVAQAINDRPVGPVSLKVMQINVGHFDMGYAAVNPLAGPNQSTVLINSSKQDGWTANPITLDRNYAVQLQRWGDFVDGVDADFVCMPEWSDYFGYNGGSLVNVANAGIFNAYRLSVGAPTSNGWFQNTVASKFEVLSETDADLHSTNGVKATARVITVRLGGKTVKIAATHLNWNNPNGATTDPAYSANATASRNSRLKEIKELVKLFQNDPYVIICGDFNSQGPVYSPDTSWSPSVRDYAAGLDEFDPFVEGFTEDGVTYAGGYTLANSRSNPMPTAGSSYSRPDQTIARPTRPETPYSYLDNIIVKGFTMSNVRVLDLDALGENTVDVGAITDHCAVVCDLTMIEEGQ